MRLDFHWIEKHLDDNTSALRLKYGRDHADDILQIEMRRKHNAKFAETLRGNPHFIFPNSLAAEQATSDPLANFHASLIEKDSVVADMTAGLGIDAMALAKKAKFVVAVEHNADVANALRINAENIKNLEVVEDDCRNQLQEWVKTGRKFDAIFIDPARRNANGGRVYALGDCEPDVVGLLPSLAKIARKLIVKASPMLDITHSVNALEPYVEQVIVLGTTTECKELDLICILGRTNSIEPKIRAVTIGQESIDEFDFTRKEEADSKSVFGVPKENDYIFDPYPAVTKAAPNKLLGQRFGLTKIGSNTHLWFASAPVDDFPGTIFRIIEVLPYMSKHIKRYASRFPKVSVTARNFDIPSDALRAKLKVSEGSLRLFAVNAFDGRKFLITCEKI